MFITKMDRYLPFKIKLSNNYTIMLFWRALLVINDWQPRAVIIKGRAKGEGLNDNCSRLTVINHQQHRQKSIIIIIINMHSLTWIYLGKVNKKLFYQWTSYIMKILKKIFVWKVECESGKSQGFVATQPISSCQLFQSIRYHLTLKLDTKCVSTVTQNEVQQNWRIYDVTGWYMWIVWNNLPCVSATLFTWIINDTIFGHV